MTGCVTYLISLWDLFARTSIGNLVVIDKDKGVLNWCSASTVNELAAYKSILTHVSHPSFVVRSLFLNGRGLLA